MGSHIFTGSLFILRCQRQETQMEFNVGLELLVLRPVKVQGTERLFTSELNP